MREGAPLSDRFPCTRDVGVLKISEAAVNRAQMVEAAAAAEVVALDQRNREPARRGVARDRKTVDAAADHEHIEGSAGELLYIPKHRRIYYPA
jgi:hypothetical protein